MKLLKRLRWALKYDIEPTFIVYRASDESPSQFLSYEDAKAFSDSQIQLRPDIMVRVVKAHPTQSHYK